MIIEVYICKYCYKYWCKKWQSLVRHTNQKHNYADPNYSTFAYNYPTPKEE